MTKAEYIRLYRQTRKDFPRLTQSAMTALRRIYLQAAKDAATKVLEAEFAGQSSLTIQSWSNIESQLSESAAEIRKALDEQIKSKVLSGTKTRANIHEKYITDAVVKVDAAYFITKKGIKSVYNNLNNKVIESLVGRIYQDGYSFSDRIWRIGQNYKDTIKDVISAGLAQGRDITKIARDIQVYTKDGKVALVQRYEKLERGTREFTKRIGNRVDFRALRLVRSELYASLQQADADAGRLNPAATGMYNWILETGRQQWACECEKLAAGGPYSYSNIPGYPHPNCSCSIRPVLMDLNNFESDLKKWVDGDNVNYIDRWYSDVYLAAA